MRVEVLIDPMMAPRGKLMLEALIDTCPVKIIPRKSYVGDCDILMMYGNGHVIRRPWWQKHVKRGGHCIGWDLGYWKHKDDGTFRMRATIDHDHPQNWLRTESPERWSAEGISLRNDYNPTGPVVVVGMGLKSVKAFGLTRLQWEKKAYRAAKAAYPDRQIVYRPKKPTDQKVQGSVVVGGDIADAIRGASLIVCRHSNVAIDACIAGIPVVCEDGAASALYGSDIENPFIPTESQRLEFLQNLAWWQWKPEESKEAWIYLLSRL